MISRVLVADLPQHVGGHVRIAGWVHRRRQLKSIGFVVIRDRSGLAQVVLTGPPASGVSEETVVEVDGLVTANEHAPGGVEITKLRSVEAWSFRAGRKRVNLGGDAPSRHLHNPLLTRDA